VEAGRRHGRAIELFTATPDRLSKRYDGGPRLQPRCHCEEAGERSLPHMPNLLISTIIFRLSVVFSFHIAALPLTPVLVHRPRSLDLYSVIATSSIFLQSILSIGS